MLTVWSANVDGLKDPHGPLPAGGSKWDRVLGQASLAQAQVVALVETHQDPIAAKRFSRQAAAAGYPSTVSSYGSTRSCGVSLLGPSELRPDTWAWPASCQGRACSAILHGRGGDLLLVAAYLPVDSNRARRELATVIAHRVHEAGLPYMLV